MKIPQRIVWSIQNSIELFLYHPLLAWNLIRYHDGHEIFWDLVGGTNASICTHNDGWKEIGKQLKDKTWHRFTK